MHYEELSKGKVHATFEFFISKINNFYILPDEFDSLMVKTKNETCLTNHFGRNEEFIFHKMVNIDYFHLYLHSAMNISVLKLNKMSYIFAMLGDLWLNRG